MVLQELGIGLGLQSRTYIVCPEILWTMKFIFLIFNIFKITQFSSERMQEDIILLEHNQLLKMSRRCMIIQDTL